MTRTHRWRAGAALLAASFTALPASALGPNGFEDSYQRSTVVGVNLRVAFGGPEGRSVNAPSWRDRADFSVGFRATATADRFAWQPTSRHEADLFALHFGGRGFDRFTLSGQNYYITNEGLSLYADEDDADKEAHDRRRAKTNKTLIYAGLGLGVLVGVGVMAVNSKTDKVLCQGCD